MKRSWNIRELLTFDRQLLFVIFIFAAYAAAALAFWRIFYPDNLAPLFLAIAVVFLFTQLAVMAEGESNALFPMIIVYLTLWRIGHHRTLEVFFESIIFCLIVGRGGVLLAPDLVTSKVDGVLATALAAATFVVTAHATMGLSQRWTILLIVLIVWYAVGLRGLAHRFLSHMQIPTRLRTGPWNAATLLLVVCGFASIFAGARQLRAEFFPSILPQHYLWIVAIATVSLSTSVFSLQLLRQFGIFREPPAAFHYWELYGGWPGTFLFLCFTNGLWKDADYQRNFRAAIFYFVIINWSAWALLTRYMSP